MGFRIPERTAILQLQDEPYAGAEITVKSSIRLGPMLRIQELSREAGGGNIAALAGLRDIFMPNLISWNLETGAGPLSTDNDGWDNLDIGLQVAIVKAWMTACVEVSSPLGEPPADITESGD